jgi:hypothetical protein
MAKIFSNSVGVNIVQLCVFCFGFCVTLVSSTSPTITSLTATSPTVSSLTVEYLIDPVAIDISFNQRPRFAWINNDGIQSSYQIQITQIYPSTTLVWDSGKVISTQSTQISYGNVSYPLPFDSDFSWIVIVTFADSSVFTSSPATFGTGPNSSSWASNAIWIGGCTQDQQSPQLRLSFTLDSQPIIRAKAYATGLGIYTLNLNGQRIQNQDVLTPGWSTIPTARVLANAYSIQSNLYLGAENVIGMRLGQAKYGYVYEFCTAGDATCYAALALLSIAQTLPNGGVNTTYITTNTDWMCSPSPIVFNHLFGGETYNESLEQPGWDAPNFIPTISWSSVTVRQPNVSEISTSGAPIRIINNVTATNLIPKNGSQPYIGGGLFVKCDTNVDVYWVATNSDEKNFVTECSPCSGIDACGNLNTVTCDYINQLKTGSNFSCSMLPVTNTSVTIFDFGRNMAGFCTLSIPSGLSIGTTLTLVHGEILNDNGDVDNTFGASSPPRTCPVNVINCADQQDVVVTGSGNAFLHQPFFTFHGFRYISLFGWPISASPPTKETLLCHQVHSDMQIAGNITFNSTTLNQIQQAIVQTQVSNIFSIPSDCPTREKRGWGGDAMGSSAQALSNLRIGAFYENWARTFSDTVFMGCEHTSLNQFDINYDASSPQRPPNYLCCDDRNEFGCQPHLTPKNATYSLPDVIPFDSISGWPGDFVWEVVGEVIPHGVLLAEGNTPYLELLWPYITAHMSFITTTASATGGLLTFGPYNDWLADEPVSLLFAENFYLTYAYSICSEMASALGKTQEAIAYSALASSVTALMVNQLYKNGIWDGGVGNMNSLAMALAVGLGGGATAPDQAITVAAMVADATSKSFHPTGGVTSIRWTLQGLTAGNQTDIALKMATVPTSPSWAYMSTPDMPGTIWESWEGDATHSDGSKNHPMFSGGIGVWFYDTVLGLRFRHSIQQVNVNIDVNKEMNDQVTKILVSNQSYFGFDPRITCGFSDSEMLALLSLSQELISGSLSIQGISLSNLISLTKNLGVENKGSMLKTTLPESKMIPIFSATPDVIIVRSLLSASGYRTAPQGMCRLSWQLIDSKSFTLQATVPSGVIGRLSIPLDFIRVESMKYLSLKRGTRTVLTAQACIDDSTTASTTCCASDPKRVSLGYVETENIVLCNVISTIKIQPKLSSWAELENLGRLFYGQNGTPSSIVQWTTGGLLINVEYGMWTWEVSI